MVSLKLKQKVGFIEFHGILNDLYILSNFASNIKRI